MAKWTRNAQSTAHPVVSAISACCCYCVPERKKDLELQWTRELERDLEGPSQLKPCSFLLLNDRLLLDMLEEQQ